MLNDPACAGTVILLGGGDFGYGLAAIDRTVRRRAVIAAVQRADARRPPGVYL